MISASAARTVLRQLPTPPRRRYGVFAGTGSCSELRQTLRAWVEGERYDDAEIIARYERAFAEQCQVSHAISFGSGRMTLFVILRALEIGAGDEVIVPAFTCGIVSEAIQRAGARPVYVDVDARSFNIDASQLEAGISPRTRAIVAQHTFGQVCEMDGLSEIARRHKLVVIEDCAHALGASHRGRPVGSLSEAAFFSTAHSKVINTHLGGMATTNDRALASRLAQAQRESPFLDRRQTRALLRSFLLEHLLVGPRMLWVGRTIHPALRYTHVLSLLMEGSSIPYPHRLSSPQAEIGLSQLRDLPRNLAHRRRLAAWLEETIGWNGIDRDAIERGTWLRYSLLVRDRQRVEAALGRTFEMETWWPTVPAGRDAQHNYGYVEGSCPVAEHVARHIVNLPTHPGVPLAVMQRCVRRNSSLLQEQMLWPSAARAQVRAES
jgi:perosamine synthetase